MRIAHVPNVSSLIERKKQLIEQRVQPYPSNKPQPPTNSSLKANSSKAESDKLSAQEVFVSILPCILFPPPYCTTSERTKSLTFFSLTLFAYLFFM